MIKKYSLEAQMTLLTTLAPPTQLLSFDDYVNYQGEPGVLYELEKGELIVMANPSAIHENIAAFLAYQWQLYFATNNLPLVAVTTTGVRTEDRTSRVPDLVVCQQSLWEQMEDRGGPAIINLAENALLLVEITSENKRTDYIYKWSEYAGINVPEYWIINPQEATIRIGTNPRGNSYEEHNFTEGQAVRSFLFPDFVFPVNLVTNPPRVEDLLREEEQLKRQLQEQIERERQRAEVERQRAEVERQRAEVEHQRAETVSQRAIKLAQMLREMGIDPDAV